MFFCLFSPKKDNATVIQVYGNTNLLLFFKLVPHGCIVFGFVNTFNKQYRIVMYVRLANSGKCFTFFICVNEVKRNRFVIQMFKNGIQLYF